MAITKLGAQILGGIEKTGLFGWNRPAPTPQPSMWNRIGQAGGRIASFANPAMWAGITAASVMSGEESLGGGLGGVGGTIAGWSLGAKGFNSLAKNMKPGALKTMLGVASGFIGSGIGESIGSGVGNAVLPFRRKPKNQANYWQDSYNGWNGQPDAY